MGYCLYALVPTHSRYSVILSMRILLGFPSFFHRLFPDFAEYRT